MHTCRFRQHQGIAKVDINLCHWQRNKNVNAQSLKRKRQTEKGVLGEIERASFVTTFFSWKTHDHKKGKTIKIWQSKEELTGYWPIATENKWRCIKIGSHLGHRCAARLPQIGRYLTLYCSPSLSIALSVLLNLWYVRLWPRWPPTHQCRKWKDTVVLFTADWSSNTK